MMTDMLEVTVDGLWRQGDKCLAVKLTRDNGEQLPAWQPGAHIDVHLPCGLIRQYSLTGHRKAANSYLICVAREISSRGGSRYVHETLRPGQTLLISPPRNLFPLQQANSVLLLAAGIGITPLYAMALELEATATPFEMHYYVKNRENVAFISQLAQPLHYGRCIIHCSSEGQSPRTRLVESIKEPQANQHLYACGPEGFMAAVSQTALAQCWPQSQIHSEAFQTPMAPVSAQDTGIFTITLASSGEKWTVPCDKTIAQVLQENGVAIPLSCEMGICGACLTPVREGRVDHRDTVQSDDEKNGLEQQIALCCSRSFSPDLLIEL